MKVIVAGFPKTGTKSLNAALTKLGYSVCDYPENVFEFNDDWGKIFHQGWTTDDFKRMYENVDAVVDVPACYFWEEIHKAFPDAKIILSLRDNEENWINSFENMMKDGGNNMLINMMSYLSPTFRRIGKNVAYPLSTAIFGISDVRLIGSQPYNRELFKLKYRAHNAHVLQNAPANKLLVYEVTEGWDPLCEFLQVPVPGEPFPHENKKGEIRNTLENHPIIRRMKREVLTSTLLLTTALGIGGYIVYKRGFYNLCESVIDAIKNLKVR